MAIWEGDPKRWYVMRVDSAQDPPTVYGRPWGGWKTGERFRESSKPIGVEPDELILDVGDCVERFTETFSRFGQTVTFNVCRPTSGALLPGDVEDDVGRAAREGDE